MHVKEKLKLTVQTGAPFSVTSSIQCSKKVLRGERRQNNDQQPILSRDKISGARLILVYLVSGFSTLFPAQQYLSGSIHSSRSLQAMARREVTGRGPCVTADLVKRASGVPSPPLFFFFFFKKISLQMACTFRSGNFVRRIPSASTPFSVCSGPASAR